MIRHCAHDSLQRKVIRGYSHSRAIRMASSGRHTRQQGFEAFLCENPQHFDADPCSGGVDVFRCTIHDAATKQQHQFTFNKCYSPTGSLAEAQVNLLELLPLHLL